MFNNRTCIWWVYICAQKKKETSNKYNRKEIMVMDVETKSISCPRGYELVLKKSENTLESNNNSEEENDNIISTSEIKTGETNEKEPDQFETEEDATFSGAPRIQISQRRYTIFNRPLIPLRVASILLAGGGRLPALFLSVFLRNRGISLVELSVVISVTSFSQMLCASVCGIIADKTGNSKPALIFLITATVIFSLCLLLTPGIKHDSCDKLKTDFNNFTDLTNVTNGKELDNCIYFCSGNKDFQHSDLLNETFIAEFGNNETAYPSFFQQKIQQRIFNETTYFDRFTADFHLLNTSANENYTDNCSLTCSVPEKNCQTNETVLVIIYALLTFLYLTFHSTSYRFMDVTIMVLVKEHNSNYGHERAFAMMSETALALVVTFGMELVDFDTFYQNKYDLVYWICAVLMILAIIALCNFKAKINVPGKRLMAKALILVKNVEFIAFVIVTFIAGTIGNFYVFFNMWLLEDIKAEKIVFGLNIAIFSFCAIPGLLSSKWWLQKFGISAIIILFLICNSIIGFGYFFLHNPWLSLILEGARGFWCNLFLVAQLQHCHDVAPLGLVSTVSAVSVTVHYAFGRTAATLGGGLLMNAVGTRNTYKLSGIVCLVTAFAYGGFIFMCRRRRKPEINVLET